MINNDQEAKDLLNKLAEDIRQNEKMQEDFFNLLRKHPNLEQHMIHQAK